MGWVDGLRWGCEIKGLEDKKVSKEDEEKRGGEERRGGSKRRRRMRMRRSALLRLRSRDKSNFLWGALFVEESPLIICDTVPTLSVLFLQCAREHAPANTSTRFALACSMRARTHTQI